MKTAFFINKPAHVAKLKELLKARAAGEVEVVALAMDVEFFLKQEERLSPDAPCAPYRTSIVW
jgi:hypothetical protein